MENNWVQEGYFIRVREPGSGIKKFYFVEQSEMARYQHTWSTTIAKDVENGPELIENLKPLSLDRLFQCVFGIKTACYLYLNLPLDSRIWGTEKKPIATSALREVGYFTQDDSPFDEPSFKTEFFLQKGRSFEYPAFTAYNPTERTLKPVLNILLNKMMIDEVTEPDVVEKLEKRLIPYRPITFGGLPPLRSGPG